MGTAIVSAVDQDSSSSALPACQSNLRDPREQRLLPLVELLDPTLVDAMQIVGKLLGPAADIVEAQFCSASLSPVHRTEKGSGTLLT
jgi:hypothetical protein